MKRILLFVLVLLMSVSCRKSTPNDRALFNLQGNVRDLTITKSSEALPDETVATIHFSKEGMITNDDSHFNIDRSYGALHVKGGWGVKISHDLQFDDEGRLYHYTTEDRSLPQPLMTETTLLYEDARRLPRAMRVVSRQGDNPPAVTEGEFTYETDHMGNWTQRTWNGEREQRKITYYNNDRSVENCPMSQYLDWRLVILLLVSVLIALPMLLHMLRRTILRKKREPMTEGRFRDLRSAAGSEVEASASECAKAREYLTEIDSLWETLPVTMNDQPQKAPLTHSQILKSDRLLRQVYAIRPTDRKIIDEYNRLGDILNKMEDRVFSGSWLFVLTTLVILLGVSLWTSEWICLIAGILCSVLYALGSMRPVFMHLRREIRHGKQRDGFVAVVFGTIFGTLTPRKSRAMMRKWNPDAHIIEIHGAERILFVIVGIVVMILFTLFMWAIAIINYLRNYIIYM